MKKSVSILFLDSLLPIVSGSPSGTNGVQSGSIPGKPPIIQPDYDPGEPF